MATEQAIRRRWQVVVFALVIVLIGAAVQWAWVSAPNQPMDVIAPSANQPDSAAIEAVSCERTLPDAPSSDLAEVTPVGRASSSAVNACPDAFDGQVVIYIGEVVGDVLQRDGGAWVLANDDAYALEVGPLTGHTNFAGTNTGLAVWLPEGQAELVDEPGNADRRGDVIQVRGVVHRTDPADGGGLTIRALETVVLVEAQYLGTRVNWVQAGLALALSLLAGAAILWERRTGGRR